MSIKKFLTPILALIIFAAPMMILSAAPAGVFAQKDLKLFRDKCGLCHGWQKPTQKFEVMPLEKRAKIIIGMQKKKADWISDTERETITALLATNDLAGLSEAVNKLTPPVDPKEIRIKYISAFHGIFMASLFLILGIGMAISGMKRHYDKLKIRPDFPGKFVWKTHVLRGKIYIIGVFLGLAGGKIIWALDGYSIAALPHFINGFAIAILFACGGYAGLKLAGGKGTAALRRVHFACNMTATVLFAFNVLSGIALLVKLFG
ncbi:MAG: DUF4079 family protein [bacterium]